MHIGTHLAPLVAPKSCRLLPPPLTPVPSCQGLQKLRPRRQRRRLISTLAHPKITAAKVKELKEAATGGTSPKKAKPKEAGPPAAIFAVVKELFAGEVFIATDAERDWNGKSSSNPPPNVRFSRTGFPRPWGNRQQPRGRGDPRRRPPP